MSQYLRNRNSRGTMVLRILSEIAHHIPERVVLLAPCLLLGRVETAMSTNAQAVKTRTEYM